MIIKGTKHFENVCKKKLVEYYNQSANIHAGPNDIRLIGADDVFVVWLCKTLQNYKALLSTTINGDGIYVEYTYNGNKQELYEDVYKKVNNRCIEEE